VEDNSYDGICSKNGDAKFVSEKYGKHNVYHCYFQGNDYFTTNLKKRCQELWQKN